MKRKRSYGSGSISQRKDGRFIVRIPNGTGRPDTFYAKTEREAERIHREKLHDRDRGRPLTSSKVTVAQFLQDWLIEVAAPRLKPRAFITYRGHIENHIIPALGTRLTLTELTATPRHVEIMLNKMLAAGKHPHTVRYTRTVLHSALKQAVKWKLVESNIVDLVDVPRAARSHVVPLTPEQARTFLQAVKGHRLEAFYSVALALGLRRGEALGLRWEDTDLDEGRLTVRYSLQRIGTRLQLTGVKTDMSRRTLYLPAPALEALRAHHTRQQQEAQMAGKRWVYTGFVFTNLSGKPIEPRYMSRHFIEVCEQAGLPRKRLHDLRHSAASLMYAQGTPLKTIAAILGHSSTRVTDEIYTHLFIEEHRDAAKRMGDWLDNKRKTEEFEG